MSVSSPAILSVSSNGLITSVLHSPSLQVMLNPFHTPTTKITSKPFDQKVKMLAKRLLG